jgi:O-antigen ligase
LQGGWLAVGTAEALTPSPPYSKWAGFAPALAIGLFAGILPLVAPGNVLWAAIAVLGFLPIVWYGFCKPKLWPLLFCGAAILLPPLPFPIGDSGVHVSIVIAAAGLLAGVAGLSEWRIERNGLNLALATLVGALAVSLGFAALYSGLALAAASAARLALFGCGVYVYFTASQGPGVVDLPQAERSARWLFAMAVAAAIFGCIDFVYQLPAPAGFGAQFIWLSSGVYRRAQGLFYDASALGNFCAFFLLMSVVALANRERRRKMLPTAVASAGAVLFLVTLLLSFSRAPLLAAGTGCVALAVLEKDRWVRSRWTSPRMLLTVGALGVVALTAFAIALPEFAAGYWARAGVDWDSIFTSPDRVLSGRLESWQTIGGFILEHPWQILAGVGYKTLPYTGHFGKPVIADNMYLSALVETGVFGLCSLLAVNAAILAVCYRAAKRGSFFGKWMFCFWVGETFQMFAGDILTFWRVLPMYFWVLAQAAREAANPETSSD